MDFITAIILGFIQGIAEWLPISSEAIVTLAGRFLTGLEYSEALGTAIWLHSGTLLAALIYFRNDIIELLKSICEKGKSKALLLFLLVTTIASAVIAVPLLYLAFSFEVPDSIATLAIGIFLIIVAFLQKERKGGSEEALKLEKAVVAGLAQGFSALPGLSRSGITISVLLAEKFPLKQAFKLSFLMSIPVSFGAQVALPLVKEGFAIDASLVLGSLAAAIVGYVTIGALMEFAEKVNFFRATLSLGVLVAVFGLLLLL